MPFDLSVVIPSYQERGRLPVTLQRVMKYLDRRCLAFEIIVVDDGSTDGTDLAAERVLRPLQERAQVLRNGRNRGKGASVQRGMLAASGDRVLLSDADLSTPIEELDKLAGALESGADIAIGSRAVDRSLIERPQPYVRDLVGRLFNLAVRALALPGIWDTQCGFKLFAARTVPPIFSRQRINGFGFDAEVLTIARLLRYRIAEVPVRWINDPDSRVSVAAGGWAFLAPLLVRMGILLGWYEEPRIRSLVAQKLVPASGQASQGRHAILQQP